MSRLLLTILIILIGLPAYAGWVEERWTDYEGNNYQGSMSSSSNSSSSGGNWYGGDRTPSPEPVYDPRTDKRLVKKKARKAFKKGDWNSAAAEASNYLELTGWKDKKILFIHARASHLSFLEWLEEGRGDGTYDWTRGQVIADYERLLGRHPNHKKALKHLAELRAMNKEDYDLHPSHVAIEYGDAHYDLGREHVRRQEWGKALDDFKTAVGWNWKDHEAHAMIGWLLGKNSEYQKAREAYLEAVHWGSKDPVVYEYLIGLHERFEDYEAVLETGEQALEIDSNQPAIYHQMAEAYERLRRPAHAMLSHEAALERDPGNPDYITEVLKIRLDFADLHEAEVLLERLKEADGWNLSFYEGKVQELRAEKERRAARSPGVQAQLDRGKELNKSGNYDEADRAFQEALEVNPNDLDVLLNSMWNNGNRNDLVRAVEDAERVLEIDHDNWDAARQSDHITVWLKEEYEAQLAARWQQTVAEVEALAAQSHKAARAETLEQAKADAMIGFDTPYGVEPNVNAEEPKDSEVSIEQRTPRITHLEDLRGQVRGKKEQVYQKLGHLVWSDSRDPNDAVELAKLRQELSDLENKENFLNFSIAEGLRVSTLAEKVEGVAAEVEAIDGDEEPARASEMSIGGEALSEEDQVHSEMALEEVRRLALADLKRKIRSRYQQNVDEVRLSQKLDAWLGSDPAAAKAVLKSQELMKRAELEYERRQQNPTVRYDSELLIDAVVAVDRREWPGEKNPAPPLENPVAAETERELAILKIYGELKQQDRLMESYDRYDRIVLEINDAE